MWRKKKAQTKAREGRAVADCNELPCKEVVGRNKAWAEFVATADKRDPLLCATLNRMSRFNVDHGIRHAEFMSDMAAANSSFLPRRGDSVQPSRWFAWQDSIMKRLENPADLHLQYLVLLSHGISMGYLALFAKFIISRTKAEETDLKVSNFQV